MAKYKEMHFYAKCSDLFHGSFYDENDNESEFDGYPPAFIGRDGVSLTIDLETGQILNWTKPSDEDIEEYIENNKC